MFELDVSLQIHAVRLVLQTVTISYAAPVRDIFKKGDAQNLLMNGLAIFKKKKISPKRRDCFNDFIITDFNFFNVFFFPS